MKHVTASDENWLFEIKEVRGIKTKSHGEPYSANVRLVIVNGELNVEGLLSRETEQAKLSDARADLREIEQQILNLGFNEYFYIRFKNGEKTKAKKVIKQ